jgi:hypothetical protein
VSAYPVNLSAGGADFEVFTALVGVIGDFIFHLFG